MEDKIRLVPEGEGTLGCTHSPFCSTEWNFQKVYQRPLVDNIFQHYLGSTF